MKYKYYILLLIIGLGSFNIANSQKRKKIPPEKPKLIITIVVEQMRYDILYRYWDKFSKGGFKRLVNEGTFCKNARYNYQFTQSSVGYATIATGAYPSTHGIVANQWYHRLKEEKTYCTFDEKAQPINYNGLFGNNSPRNLLTSTFADELKLFNNNSSKSIGISLTDYASILPSGHMADASFWFDIKKGNWVSSSYYMDSLPNWVVEFNNKKYSDLYLDRTWNTKLPIENYIYNDVDSYSLGIHKQFLFPYDLSKLRKKDKDYSLLWMTPLGNTLTKDFAIASIINEGLGLDDTTDFVTVSFTATSGVYKLFGPASVELEDTYLRLDEELEHFLSFIDDHLSKEDVLVVLTSDHGSVRVPEFLKENNIPSGYFNYKKALILLKSYLNFIYGKGEWVNFYHKQQIYLNHLLIEDSKLNLADFQKTVSQFIIQFAGVANTVTANSLEQTHFEKGPFSKIQNSYNQNRSGDVILNLEPGWIEEKSVVESENSAYSYDTHVPLIWYGWKIGRKTINRKIDMIDIAPTITYFLEISEPNGCNGEVIMELVE